MTAQILRPYQQACLDRLMIWADAAMLSGEVRQTTLVQAPCGSGKGTTQLALCEAFRDNNISTIIVTPSIEILRGNLERLGHPGDMSASKTADLAWELGMTTPVRFANRLAAGECEAPMVVIVDEVHGWVESNSIPDVLFTMAPMAAFIGFTATPFRGTAKGTAALRDVWGEPHEMISLRDCVAKEYILFPRFSIAPLVNDDCVKIVNGELSSKGVTEAYHGQLPKLADLCEEFYQDDLPTVVAVGSTEVAHLLHAELERRSVRSDVVLQDTSGEERAAIYKRCQRGVSVLIQLRVLSVGADLPKLEILIDAQPTLSPVLYMQTVGRIMRNAEGKNQPRVICTNRNLERHGYLFQGLMPDVAVRESQDAYDGPCATAGGGRVLGFERLNKFKILKARLDQGGFVSFYNLYSADETARFREWIVMFTPWGDILTGSRLTGAGRWDKWERCELPPVLTGFQTSKKKYTLSPKMEKWWERSARGKGLVANDVAEISAREFQILPALFDMKLSLRQRRERLTAPREARREESEPVAPKVTKPLTGLAGAFAAALDELDF